MFQLGSRSLIVVCERVREVEEMGVESKVEEEELIGFR